MSRFDEGDDDGYFFDEDDKPSTGGHRPMPRAPPVSQVTADEDDPLDAFMADLNKELAQAPAAKPSSKNAKAGWEELQSDDPVASYCDHYAEVMGRGGARPGEIGGDDGGSDGEAGAGSDEDGDRRKKAIEPLPALDHTQIRYAPVRTEFFQAHADLAKLSISEIENLRKELRISATGSNCPAPAVSFAHMGLSEDLMEGIRKHGYSKPFPIQAQAIPGALSGRDVIGIAETGSGKTMAYLLPMFVHILAQPELAKDEGPIGLVLCPTRELSIQIEKEVFKFNKRLGLRSTTLAGGLSKLEQFKEIKRGAEIVIANPGRFIDIVKMKGCNLRRCTYVVIDEADRMMGLGFEYQIRSIVQNVRPSRQTLLFSATFPPRIEKLARDLLHQPVRITVGALGQAAANIVQYVEVLKNDDDKWPWLSKRVDAMLAKGQVLIFVRGKQAAEELSQNFIDFLGKKTAYLHGDMDQGERMKTMRQMQKRQVEILIATDVAARGLDIPTISTVVSYDVSRDIETHTHRVGRTGRAGAKGDAFTLITSAAKINQGDKDDKKIAALLVGNLKQAGSAISPDLQALAMKHAPFRAAHLSGREWDGRKDGQTGQQRSVYGLGFDGQPTGSGKGGKETSQELSARLDKEADKQMRINKNIMQGTGRRAGAFVPQGSGGGLASGGPAGFVAQATVDERPHVESTKPDSDSDDDLMAPGVTQAFGGSGGGRGPTSQMGGYAASSNARPVASINDRSRSPRASRWGS